MTTTTTTTTSLLLFFFLSLALFPLTSLAGSSSQCKAWLVQSIPTDMPHLPRVPGVLSTADVFRWLAGNSTRRLDIITQNWQLLSQPDNPQSGDYGYSKADMERFGANNGFEVYKSIENAADRNVNIRILQHTGFYPDYNKESSSLASGRPNVKNVTLLLSDWWGSGFIHAKVWISDRKDIYIGSANNDWKSLTQVGVCLTPFYLPKQKNVWQPIYEADSSEKNVKEVGIYLVGCPSIAKKVEVYYDNLWKLASINSSAYTKTVWDQQWLINRKVPCWSHFLNFEERCRSPLPSYVEVPHVAGYPILSDPYMFQMPIETPSYNNSSSQQHSSYLSFAPPELSFGKFQADEQAWVDTIKSVGPWETVRISTMNWLGQSQDMKQTVYWSSISSAISEVVFSKHAIVKILVASVFMNNADQYLKSLLYSNVLCASSKYKKCAGKIEIKYYKVPGFNITGAALLNGMSTGNIYPGNSRFNQGKYAVSDERAHIGTSNLIWDHFYTTSGVSFGTYNPAIVSQLQEIFDADWNSPYVVPVEPLEGIQIYSSR